MTARIRDVQAIPLGLPLHKPMLMAGLRVARAETLYVRIEDSDGVVGWGEAAAAPTMTGETLVGMAAAVRNHLGPALLGRPLHPRGALTSLLAAAIYGNAGARSAVETALLDLVARRLGVPLHELLGGARRDAMEPLWLVGTASAEGDVADAVARVAEGYRFLKLKLGVKSVEEEERAMAGLRRALGDDVRLAADANMGLSLPDARRLAEAGREAGYLFLEQPLRHDDLRGMAAVAATGLPISADEGVHGIADLEAHAALGAAQGAALKSIKLGGPSAVLEAASACHRLGFSVNLSAKVAESSLGAAALLHLAACLPDLAWGVSPTQAYLAEDPVKHPIGMRGGQLALPSGPGLGVSVEESRLGRFRLD
jgi:muconate cycloisomerase